MKIHSIMQLCFELRVYEIEGQHAVMTQPQLLYIISFPSTHI